MQKRRIEEELAEIPASLRSWVEELAEHWPVESVQHRWRAGTGRGRYRATGTDLEIAPSDSPLDVASAVLALAEEVDDEEGAAVQHQVRYVRQGEPGRWHRFRLAAATSQDVAEAATRFAGHCERVAVRAMGYLEQQLRLQAELGRQLAEAMRPAVQLRKLELQHELAREESEQRAQAQAALLETLQQFAPALLAAWQQSRTQAGRPDTASDPS